MYVHRGYDSYRQNNCELKKINLFVDQSPKVQTDVDTINMGERVFFRWFQSVQC